MKKQYLVFSLLACNVSVSHINTLPSKSAPRVTIASAVAGAAVGFGLSKYIDSKYNPGWLSVGAAGIVALASWVITQKYTPTGIMHWADKCIAGLQSNEKVETIKAHIQDKVQLLKYLDALYDEQGYTDYPDSFTSYPRLQMVEDLKNIISQCDKLLVWLRTAQSEAQEHDNFNNQRRQKHYDYVIITKDMIKRARGMVKESDEYKEQKKIYDSVQKALAQRPVCIEYHPVYYSAYYPPYYWHRI